MVIKNVKDVFTNWKNLNVVAMSNKNIDYYKKASEVFPLNKKINNLNDFKNQVNSFSNSVSLGIKGTLGMANMPTQIVSASLKKSSELLETVLNINKPVENYLRDFFNNTLNVSDQTLATSLKQLDSTVKNIKNTISRLKGFADQLESNFENFFKLGQKLNIEEKIKSQIQKLEELKWSPKEDIVKLEGFPLKTIKVEDQIYKLPDLSDELRNIKKNTSYFMDIFINDDPWDAFLSKDYKFGSLPISDVPTISISNEISDSVINSTLKNYRSTLLGQITKLKNDLGEIANAFNVAFGDEKLSLDFGTPPMGGLPMSPYMHLYEWQGTKPIQLDNIKIEFNWGMLGEYSAEKEVFVPAVGLFSMFAPTYSQGKMYGPLPSSSYIFSNLFMGTVKSIYDYIKKTALETSSSQKLDSIDTLYKNVVFIGFSILKDFYSKYKKVSKTFSFRIKGIAERNKVVEFFHVKDMIVNNISIDFSNQIDEKGFPIKATVTLSNITGTLAAVRDSGYSAPMFRSISKNKDVGKNQNINNNSNNEKKKVDEKKKTPTKK